MGLENRRSGNVSEGSNPSLSAISPADATVSDARSSRCSVSVPAGGDGTEVGTVAAPRQRGRATFNCKVRPKPPRKPVVYFLQASTGHIKIGTTGNLPLRIEGLRNSCPVHLDLLAAVKGDRATENKFHATFAAHRLHGEWFAPHPEILAEIDRLKAMQEQAA